MNQRGLFVTTKTREMREAGRSTPFSLFIRKIPELDSHLGWRNYNIDFVWADDNTDRYLLLEEKRFGSIVKYGQAKVFGYVDKGLSLDPNYYGFHVLKLEKELPIGWRDKIEDLASFLEKCGKEPSEGKMWLDGREITLDELIDRMRAENVDQRRTHHHKLPALDVTEANRLATAATWPAWNTVEGPNKRNDDPHDSYLDRFTAGLTIQESARMRAIESLFPQLQRFVSAGPMPGALHLRDLAGAISLARPNVYFDSPIRYRPDMWVKDHGDFWRKARG